MNLDEETQNINKEPNYDMGVEMPDFKALKKTGTPGIKQKVSELLKIHTYITIVTVVFAIVGVAIFLFVSVGLAIPYMISSLDNTVDLKVDNMIGNTAGVLGLLFAPGGLFITVFRYGYLKGLLDIIRGEKTQYMYYITHIKEFIQLFILEISLIVVSYTQAGEYAIGGKNIVGNEPIKIVLLGLLFYITRIAIMVRMDEKTITNKQVVGKTLEILQSNWVTFLIMLVVFNITMLPFVTVTTDITLKLPQGIKYIQSIIIVILYVRYREEETRIEKQIHDQSWGW